MSRLDLHGKETTGPAERESMGLVLSPHCVSLFRFYYSCLFSRFGLSFLEQSLPNFYYPLGSSLGQTFMPKSPGHLSMDVPWA